MPEVTALNHDDRAALATILGVEQAEDNPEEAELDPEQAANDPIDAPEDP